jgi:hypothetical protein
VVALRKGKLKANEFMVRPGDKGLSFFASVPQPSSEEVVSAVRAMGKKGDLTVALFNSFDLERMGLTVVPTMGGTMSSKVNAIHFEARLPFWRQLVLRLRGLKTYEYFNCTFLLSYKN